MLIGTWMLGPLANNNMQYIMCYLNLICIELILTYVYYLLLFYFT